MGATHTIKVTTRDSKVLAKQIINTLGCQPDQSIECSGVESSIATAIHVCWSILCVHPLEHFVL